MSMKFGPLIGSGFYNDASGGGAGYTTEQAQDAIGNILIDSSSINSTYTDAPPSIELSLPDVVSAGEYGGPGNDLQVTVNAKGVITSISEAPISIAASSVSDFVEKSQDAAGNVIQSSTSVLKTYNDAANTLSLSAIYSATTPGSIGVASVGVSNSPARSDHVHGHALTTDGDIFQYSSGISRLAIGSANKHLMSDGSALSYSYPYMVPGVWREIIEDFLTGTATSTYYFSSSTSVGTVNFAETAEAGCLGIASVATGTTTTGRAMIYVNTTEKILIASNGNNFDIVMKAKVTAAADGTNSYLTFFGITDKTATSGEPANGVYFYHDQNSSNWVIKNSNASTRSSTTTSVAVDSNWHIFRIKITGSLVAGLGTHQFYIDGVSVGTITTNTTPNLGQPTLYIEKTAGTTTRLLYCDYINTLGYI